MDASDLTKFIEARNIDAEIILLKDETPTVEAAAEAVGVKPEQIIKSVLFVIKHEDDNYEPLLVIANGLSRIDYKRLADYLGVSRRRVRIAAAKEVLAITGYPVGTIPPFGHKQTLPTLLEVNVTKQTEIYAGGGDINALMRLTVDTLQRVLEAEVVSLAA